MNICKWMMGMAVGSAVALSGNGLWAQAAPAAPRKIYTNKGAFKLPLRVEERDVPRLQEVQLFVRPGPGGAWAMKEAVPPTQTEFIYRVSQDGEYWFTVVTVDKTGRRNPADLANETPGLVVVVDKQPPEVDVRPMTSPTGLSLLQCDVRDANPDPSKTKMEYQTADQNWQKLEPVPDQANVFRVPDPSAMRGMVRVTAGDLAGNMVTKEVNLVTSAAPSTVATTASNPLVYPPPTAGTAPNPLVYPPPPPPGTSPIAAPGVNPSVPHAVESSAMLPAFPEAKPVPDYRVEKPAAPQAYAPGNAVRQLVNSTHLPLLYQVDQEGPSGIAKVEVWMTRDDGQTWQKLCEDPDRRSPVEIDLPGDGTYGLNVVVTGGNGNGSTPPKVGDQPDWRIEVDTAKPIAQILAIRPGAVTEPGSFLITWTASDKNLKPEPIALEYATNAAGPWVAIARGLKNDGNYRWCPPRELAGEVHLRMQVSDAAGNTATCPAPQPLVLDRSCPKAKILGIMNGQAGVVQASH